MLTVGYHPPPKPGATPAPATTPIEAMTPAPATPAPTPPVADNPAPAQTAPSAAVAVPAVAASPNPAPPSTSAEIAPEKPSAGTARAPQEATVPLPPSEPTKTQPRRQSLPQTIRKRNLTRHPVRSPQRSHRRPRLPHFHPQRRIWRSVPSRLPPCRLGCGVQATAKCGSSDAAKTCAATPSAASTQEKWSSFTCGQAETITGPARSTTCAAGKTIPRPCRCEAPMR